MPVRNNIGALIIRLGFGGILYYNHNHNKEPPKPYSNYYGLYFWFRCLCPATEASCLRQVTRTVGSPASLNTGALTYAYTILVVPYTKILVQYTPRPCSNFLAPTLSLEGFGGWASQSFEILAQNREL